MDRRKKRVSVMNSFERMVERLLHEMDDSLPPPGPVRGSVSKPVQKVVKVNRALASKVPPPTADVRMLFHQDTGDIVVRVDDKDHFILRSDGTWRSLR